MRFGVGIVSDLEPARVSQNTKVSEQSFYRWKAKYGGMDVSAVERLEELELRIRS